jgi:biopolymer transport protein ExbD
MRRHPLFAMPRGGLGPAPIVDLNTTPLIDVMLVLLIMFIVTIPIGTHKVAIALPQDPGRPVEQPTVHRLLIDASGGLSWDGAAISDQALRTRLVATARQPLSVLELRSDGETRYDRVDHVLADIKRAGIERLGLAGNEGFASSLR